MLTDGVVVADRYRLIRPIGRGGSSEVWVAEHMVTHRQFALKVLRSRDGDHASRFIREARIATELRHPNVVPVHDVFELDSDRSLVMVMDLLLGESLATRLADRKTLPLSQVAALTDAITSALEAAHARGIVHRDLKPENIFLAHNSDGTECVKVLDFGIARWRPDVAPDPTLDPKTDTGTVLGTPHYMAPEQLFGERTIDGRADIWSLGVVLYRCLSGALPFNGENAGQIFKSITLSNAPPLTAPIPGSLKTSVSRMLSRDPKDRPTLAAVRETVRAASTLPNSAPQRGRERIVVAVIAVTFVGLAASVAITRTRAPSYSKVASPQIPGRSAAAFESVTPKQAIAISGPPSASAETNFREVPPATKGTTAAHADASRHDASAPAAESSRAPKGAASPASSSSGAPRLPGGVDPTSPY